MEKLSRIIQVALMETEFSFLPVMMFIMIMINIINRHKLDLDRPVVASFNCLFQGIPSRLHPFCL
jgi:hypothetical protein